MTASARNPGILEGEDSLDSERRFLATHPYFEDLNAKEIERIAVLAAVRTYDRGEIISLEGDPCTAVYFVLKGRVHAVKTSLQGREQVIDELGPGQPFYVVPALDGKPLPVTSRAATEATLISFARADFLDLLSRHSGVCMKVLVGFASRLRRLSALVEDLALRSVSQRLAQLLIRRVRSEEGHRMTQREMAARLGTVREVVSRTLARFEQDGYIDVRRGVIEILDLDALASL